MSRTLHREFPSRRGRGLDRAARLLVVLLSPLLLLEGCTSTRYQSAPKQTPPPVLINLPSTEPPVEALLHTVIIFRGPGSWKHDAYWDEYVVTVANRGNALITVDSVWLTDFQGQATEAGTDPWLLEATSRSLADKSFGLAQNTVLQIGGGVGVMAVGGGVGAVIFSGGFVTSAGGAAIGGILLLPAFIGGTIYTNINNRHAIEHEFERRRLALPAELVPGQLVQGSLFFRLSPGPQRLTLSCHINRQPRDIIIDLTPIAGLHLKALGPTPAATPGTPRGG